MTAGLKMLYNSTKKPKDDHFILSIIHLIFNSVCPSSILGEAFLSDTSFTGATVTQWPGAATQQILHLCRWTKQLQWWLHAECGLIGDTRLQKKKYTEYCFKMQHRFKTAFTNSFQSFHQYNSSLCVRVKTNCEKKKLNVQ